MDAAIHHGADYVGLVHFPKSPRHVDLPLASRLAAHARTLSKSVKVVMLLVDPDHKTLHQVAERVKPDVIQLHGHESVAEIGKARAQTGLSIFKAVSVQTADDVAAASVYSAGDLADVVLFDAKPPADPNALPGGNGLTFDWHMLDAWETDKPFALAGGLTPENVADAIRLTRASIVDVSSGVESAPGLKDEALIRLFIARAKAAKQGALSGFRYGITMATKSKKSDADKLPKLNSFASGPDERGHFGIYGGRFVAETLMPLILDLEKAYTAAKNDPAFQAEVEYLNTYYAGRPSPLYYAERMTDHLRDKAAAQGGRGGAKIYFKRDELNHTGSHKINNCLGQILLARRMGKTRIIAETGAGQHGVAVATVCARFGLPCEIFMGATDVERQSPNVARMHMLGAKINPVTSGAGTLKDAMNEALRDWVTNVKDTYYIIGTAAGPHPYPAMVRDFQSVIGREAKEQMMAAEGRLPDVLVACIGGGSNAIGLFHPFLDDASVKIFGVEAGGHGIEIDNGHAASMSGGTPGVLHGNRTYLLQDGDGQIQEGHSISAGLDYPGVGPEHSWLKDTGRVTYVPITDKEALDAFQLCARTEGIIPALEPAHALAFVKKLAPTLAQDQLLIMNLCGRGDKDVFSVAKHLGIKI